VGVDEDDDDNNIRGAYWIILVFSAVASKPRSRPYGATLCRVNLQAYRLYF